MKTVILKKFRKNLKLTQKEMAEQLGIKRSAYAMIESGRRSVSLELAKKISDISNKPIEEIFFDFECHNTTNLKKSA